MGDEAHAETVAELTACVLAAVYGFDYTANAWSYIESYNPDDPIAAMQAAMDDVGNVLAYIFPKEEEADGEESADAG